MEDRFSFGYFSQNQGDYNQLAPEGDPVLELLNSPHGMIQHPHNGRQMSCASCHFVDQAAKFQENLVFAYNDFTQRTPIPWRNSAGGTTLRNSQNLVMVGLEPGLPLHWDGEFFSMKELVCAGFAGRNMGWLAHEQALASANVARVIREDNGTYPNDADLKGAYKDLYARLGFDISQKNNQEIMDQTCEFVVTFMRQIDFSRDEQGLYNGSAYDEFLIRNNIRRAPQLNETAQQYTEYIRNQLNTKTSWVWVEPQALKYHAQASQFGYQELEGMKTFFNSGQCASCHTPPRFTNSGFHNVGVSQLEYDGIHGRGAFGALKQPTWVERLQKPELYWTATPQHPDWQGIYGQVPKVSDPQQVDLGAWNVLGHPDKRSVQAPIRKALCESTVEKNCAGWSDDNYLNFSFGAFKTPTLRSLGQSAPYFHNGRAWTLEEVMKDYLTAARLAKKGELVGGDPRMQDIDLLPTDLADVEAFMLSLNEDYDSSPASLKARGDSNWRPQGSRPARP
jgi:cytochrome c peroxidase